MRGNVNRINKKLMQKPIKPIEPCKEHSWEDTTVWNKYRESYEYDGTFCTRCGIENGNSGHLY